MGPKQADANDEEVPTYDGDANTYIPQSRGSMLFGYPVIIDPSMPHFSTDNCPIILADFRRWRAVRVR